MEASVSETPESSAVSEPSPVATASGAPSTPATSTTSSAAPVELPILRRGMYGPAVARLQQRLQGLGFYNGAIDGIFGPGTEQAVQQAQQQYRLSPDGIVGSATWSALLR
ncbi:MAG: hypothetical protein HC873_01115 [Leptolyngbyaceae cyanobacterium SL_1_1]|nr:hypothetical protein [Leptolyngbyaceae cyanobacterium SL_1_1]